MINLYYNTLLDGCVILSVCSFAIETTFPLSNFKTKHILGILMALRKVEDHLGRRRRPKFIFNFFSRNAAQSGSPS